MKTQHLSIIIGLVAASALAQGPNAERTFIVRTGHPTRATISQSIVKTGELSSPATVDISAKVSGRLASLELEDGTRLEEGVKVAKGQRIATIDSRDYAAQLAAAEAALAAAEATRKDAEREFKRSDMLFKEGTATEKERDQAEAALERAVASVEQSKAQLALAQINLDETVLYAPMDGVVSARHVEPGTLLSAGAKVLTITQLNPLRFQLAVPTTLFAQLALDETGIQIDVDAYPGQPVSGVLSRIYPVADGATRTVRIETIVDNSDGRYLPGMYATGTIALNRRENAMVVPFDSVVRNADERLVYRVKDGRAEVVKVKLGIRQDAIVEVLEGLSESDDIVIAGQHRLSDGVPVKLETVK